MADSVYRLSERAGGWSTCSGSGMCRLIDRDSYPRLVGKRKNMTAVDPPRE